MGVGVSYTGHDGRTRKFNADSAPTAGSDMDRLFGAQREIGRRVDKGLEEVMHKTAANAPKGEEAKVMSGSAIVKTREGLCLRGEEYNPNVEGRRFFASLNGRKGFFTLAEMDANTDGRLVGIPQNSSAEPDETERKIGDRGGWRIPWSRTAFEFGRVGKDEDADLAPNQVRVVQLYREIIVSEDGRIVAMTGEKKTIIGVFNVGGEGGGIIDLEYSTDTHRLVARMADGTEKTVFEAVPHSSDQE